MHQFNGSIWSDFILIDWDQGEISILFNGTQRITKTNAREINYVKNYEFLLLLI